MLFIFLACHNNQNKLEIVKDHVFNADPIWAQFRIVFLSIGKSFRFFFLTRQRTSHNEEYEFPLKIMHVYFCEIYPVVIYQIDRTTATIAAFCTMASVQEQ